MGFPNHRSLAVSTTAAPEGATHLKTSLLAKPHVIFATVGFVLHMGTFCHSALKNKTKEGQKTLNM